MSTMKATKAIPFLLILTGLLCIGMILQTAPAFAKAPEAPAQPVWSDLKPATQDLKLNWVPVDKANGYKLFQKNAATESFDELTVIADGAVSSYQVEGLEPLTTYEFQIQAYKTYTQYYNSTKKKWVNSKPKYARNFKGKKTREATLYGEPSEIAEVTTQGLALTQPKKLKAKSPGYRRVDLTWKAVKGAASYTVFEYNSSGENIGKKKVAASESPAVSFYSKTVGSTYSYKVRANAKFDGLTFHSDYSQIKTVTAQKTYIGQAVGDENGKTRGGKAGDQKQISGNKPGEVSSLGTWKYSSKSGAWNNWRFVLRFKDPAKAEAAAKAMVDACNNANIGYDQAPDGGRGELYKRAKKNNFDLSAIKKPCETSCSPLVAVCVNAAGVFPKFNARSSFHDAPYDTSEKNFIDPLKKTGEFTVFTDKKYTADDAYLQRGDIIVSPGHHTGMIL